jgi:hypothetical protein
VAGRIKVRRERKKKQGGRRKEEGGGRIPSSSIASVTVSAMATVKALPKQAGSPFHFCFMVSIGDS